MNAVSPRRHTFRKSERLNGRKAIEQLVASGKNIIISPFKLMWIPILLPTDSPAQIAFSVPKRNFKKAVDRNRMKRLMRESYRKNKSDIYTSCCFSSASKWYRGLPLLFLPYSMASLGQ